MNGAKLVKRNPSNFRYAWTASLPVLFGYVTLGFAYGLYMHNLGFSFNVLLITAVLGFRQFFYGVAMLSKYPQHGWRKWLLIFGLSDETFVLNYYTKIPAGYDSTVVRTWISVLDYFYWAFGALCGGCLGGVLNLQVKGLDFVMTALFLVLAVEQFLKEKNHWSSLSGLVITIGCLLVFGKLYFMIATLLLLVLEYYWFSYRKGGSA